MVLGQDFVNFVASLFDLFTQAVLILILILARTNHKIDLALVCWTVGVFFVVVDQVSNLLLVHIDKRLVISAKIIVLKILTSLNRRISDTDIALRNHIAHEKYIKVDGDHHDQFEPNKILVLGTEVFPIDVRGVDSIHLANRLVKEALATASKLYEVLCEDLGLHLVKGDVGLAGMTEALV